MLSKKEKSEPEAKSEDDSYEEPKTYLSSADNLLDYLFSNCEFIFNNTRASNALEINPQSEQLLNEFILSALSNKRTLACHGYSFEEHREAFGMCSFTDSANSLGTRMTFSFYGRLAIDLLNFEKRLLPKIKVRIERN